MYQVPTIMLDFETTGLSPAAGARITEVAALRIEDGRIVDRFVTLVNCCVEIPPFITSLTGITQQMVDDAPCVSEAVPRLLEFIGDAPLAAHNASFDEKFLRAEGELLGLMPRHSHLLCSLKLSRRLLPGMPSYGLGKLASRLGIRFSGQAHRAEADAEGWCDLDPPVLDPDQAHPHEQFAHDVGRVLPTLRVRRDVGRRIMHSGVRGMDGPTCPS